jgi:hypothetical protein
MRRKHLKSRAGFLCLLLLFAPSIPAQSQGQPKAGRIAAELPVGNIERAGQSQVAALNMDILWEDVVRTSDRGRVRILLDDSSILNVGSNSTLRVTKHDAQTRETELELTVGKMRSRLQRIETNRGQRFQIKTSTAVIGAVGTDFFVEATPQFTRVIVYEGAVIVFGLGAAVAASQTVLAGNQTTVFPEQPPSSPQPASQADIQQSQEETDVGPALPPPPPPAKKAGFPALLKNKWFWIAAGAATAVTVGIVVGTRDKRTVTGCPVPSAASPSSVPAASIAAAPCPP